MSTGLLSGLLGTQPVNPAGQSMRVVMIDRKNIVVNPDNQQIYVIGDVSRLKEDIKTNGIRQPLEVVDLEDGNYKLIGGERRLTACEELAKEGDDRFEVLPCIILQSKSPDDDKIALITANATARELTDGERLAQYEVLKEILSRRKKNGELVGKVRDELCRILGLSAGAAARLNAIAENCDEKTKQKLRSGEISLMGAYRYAQAVIADKTADIKMPDAVKENPKVFEPKNETSVTLPKQEPKCPEWVIESVKEVCELDWVKAASEFTAEALVKAKGGACGRSLKNGFVDFDNRQIRFWWSRHGEYIFTWAKFVRFCVENGFVSKPEPAKSMLKKTKIIQNHGLPENPTESRGRDTLRKLAEKMLREDAPWEMAWEDVQFKTEYDKQPLPGGATLWQRVDETRKEAGQPCEDYAIILQDNKFYTCGWISFHSGITDILTKYFELK